MSNNGSETFPLNDETNRPADETAGFKCSLSGVLLRASERMQRTRDSRYLAYPLTQLCDHIDELRQATSNADAVERLAKFLRYWV